MYEIALKAYSKKCSQKEKICSTYTKKMENESFCTIHFPF
ncbi:hypothetical protein RV18_GL001148 [Enterococcus termitis]|nr:hypothetical protein RV18_GL001148 [Enterococcus termitis]